MIVTINYGDKKLKLNLPENASLDEFEPNSPGTILGPDDFDKAILSGETGMFPVSDADLYVINDPYRPTPSAVVFDWLEQIGKINREAMIIIATGCHARPSDDSLKKLLGRWYDVFENRIHIHDSRDRAGLIEVGRDDDGSPVYLNRYIVEAERVLLIGSVEPHYFAGFTGGRKSVFPGLTDFETTVRNHNRAVSLDARPMKLEGNPIEENLQFLMKFIDGEKLFSIQLVLGNGGEIHAAFCGQIQPSFDRAAEYAASIYGHQLATGYDLLLAEVIPPLDSNLYQLQKSLENCQSAVNDRGTAILFSPCHEGIGSDSFYRLAARWSPDEQALPDGVDAFGRHKLSRVYDIGRRIKVILYSDLDEGISDRVYYKTEKDPQRIIDKLGKKNKFVKTALVHNAGHTVLANR